MRWNDPSVAGQRSYNEDDEREIRQELEEPKEQNQQTYSEEDEEEIKKEVKTESGKDKK